MSVDRPEYLHEEEEPPPTPEEEETFTVPPWIATHVTPYRLVVGSTRTDDLLVLVGNDGGDVVLTTNLPRDRVAGMLARMADLLRAGLT